MLTNDEADVLASIRRNVSELFSFNSQYLDRDSIHQRYADLIAQRQARESEAV